jgi:CRISPR/Cas system-associated exonuclease Cas4 (RecB family)
MSNEPPTLTKKHLKIFENTKRDIQQSDSIDSLLSNKITFQNDLNFSEPTKLNYIGLRKHISYSEIATWMDCSHKHKLKYLDEIKAEGDGPSEHTEYGQVVHDALEEYLKTRMMPSIDSLKSQLTQMFSVLPNVEKLKEADWHDTLEPVLSEVPAFMEETFGNDWEYIAAEYPLMESIEHHDHMFKGFIDGIVKAKNKKGEEVVWIIDWKSCSYFWPMAKRTDPKKTMQLAFYKYFYSKKFNLPLNKVKCGFVLLRRSKKKGNCELVTVSVGDKAVEKAMGTIDNMLGYIQKKMFPKNRESCKYCPYAGTEHCP